jgi:hypothetical protein
VARRLVVICALAGALAAGAAPPAGAAVRRVPVVFVSFDEFPSTSLLDAAGAVDRARFPNFAYVAANWDWFPNATTVADGTRVATPTVFGGIFPRPGSIPILGDYPSNLLAVLARSHAIHAVEPVTRLCPPRACPGRKPLPRGPRRRVAQALAQLIQPAKEQATRTSPLATFIRGIRPWRRGKPPLYFIHVLLPHHPWRWLPNGASYRESLPEIPAVYGDNLWRNDPTMVQQGWERHLLQVGYADLLLGRLIARLRATGLYDRAVIVLAADHGVSFVSGLPRRKVTRSTFGGIAPIPFFLKESRQRAGRRIDAHVQSPDILPTTAAALGLGPLRRVDGHNALDPAFRPSPTVRVWLTTFGFGRQSLSIPYAGFDAQRRAVVARQSALFGDGGFGPRFFRVGPYVQLIGRRVAGLSRGRAGSARFDGPHRGARVLGTVSGVGPGRAIAAVVGGRVAATSRTYAFRGTRFSLFLPPAARRGVVTLYAIDARRGRVTLRRVG